MLSLPSRTKLFLFINKRRDSMFTIIIERSTDAPEGSVASRSRSVDDATVRPHCSPLSTSSHSLAVGFGGRRLGWTRRTLTTKDAVMKSWWVHFLGTLNKKSPQGFDVNPCAD